MALKTKKLSLAEKISSLVTAAPAVFGSDDENEETKAKVVDRYDESGSDDDAVGSAFRKRNVGLLDEVDNRYKGKKVSRKDVYEEDNESEASDFDESEDNDDNNNDDNDDDSEDVSEGSEAPEASDAESESEKSENNEIGSEAEESGSEEDDESEVDEDNPLRRERRHEANFKNMTETNVRADVEKGNCVREQLKIWENLLEVRIKLQKCLIASNQMPQPETFTELKSDDKFKKETNETTKKLSGLLDNLLEMQDSLLGNYPETKNLRSRGKKRKAGETEKTENEDPMDEEIPSDTEDEMEKDGEEEEDEEASEEEADGQPEKKKKKKCSLAEYEKMIAENHSAYRDYRNSVIQKWNDKTRVATGSVNKGSSQAVVKQIEFVLSDKTKLLKRTQLKRSEYDVVGKATTEDEDGRRTQEYDTEIYDDDDFYHQLLRELIEYKSSDITDPIQLSKQWIQLQNMRNKMKRKIDTRATKGRRIRYNVHTKLVNFMAPVGVNDCWSDLAKNELYNSLFGKIKSSSNETTTNEGASEKL